MRPAPMRGYSDIMNTSDNPSVELHGNGQRVTLPHEEVGAHTLWKQNSSTRTPIWHLRVTVLKDGDIRGDCPNRIFVSLLILSFIIIHLLIAFLVLQNLRGCHSCY